MATILVVDDEPMMLDLLGTILQRLRHDVIPASTGTEAVALYQRKAPHLVILDLQLPDMSGIDVLRKIREAHPAEPVIILTGAGTDALERQARELGVQHFIQKGFSLHNLGEALRSVLKGVPQSLSARANRGTGEPS